eukprot:Clim_evm12s248 gene=Clim_evmTU12s248
MSPTQQSEDSSASRPQDCMVDLEAQEDSGGIENNQATLDNIDRNQNQSDSDRMGSGDDLMRDHSDSDEDEESDGDEARSPVYDMPYESRHSPGPTEVQMPKSYDEAMAWMEYMSPYNMYAKKGKQIADAGVEYLTKLEQRKGISLVMATEEKAFQRRCGPNAPLSKWHEQLCGLHCSGSSKSIADEEQYTQCMPYCLHRQRRERTIDAVKAYRNQKSADRPGNEVSDIIHQALGYQPTPKHPQHFYRSDPGLISRPYCPNKHARVFHTLLDREIGGGGRSTENLRRSNLFCAGRQSRGAGKATALGHRAYYQALAWNDRMVRWLAPVKEVEAHAGCVNAVWFNQDGSRLLTGSDDLKVFVWKTDGPETEWGEPANKIMTVEPGHTHNIFQAQYVPFTGDRCMITCAADGRYIQSMIRPDGSCEPKMFRRHMGRAHKFAIHPEGRFLLTCAEDGKAFLYDMRTSEDERVQLLTSWRGHALYSVDINPRQTNHFVVSGTAASIDEFDLRYCRSYRNADDRLRSCTLSEDGDHPNLVNHHKIWSNKLDSSDKQKNSGVWDVEPLLNKYIPSRTPRVAVQHAPPNLRNEPHATSLRYSRDGTRILGNFNDDDLYAVPSDYGLRHGAFIAPSNRIRALQQYSGARNADTVKGCTFLGPNSEYVAGGCDSGNLFIWRADNGELINCIMLDSYGAVNCITEHPHRPVLVTGGLDASFKVVSGCKADTFQGQKLPAKPTGYHKMVPNPKWSQLEENQKRRSDGYDDDIETSLGGAPDAAFLRALFQFGSMGDDVFDDESPGSMSHVLQVLQRMAAARHGGERGSDGDGEDEDDENDGADDDDDDDEVPDPREMCRQQ